MEPFEIPGAVAGTVLRFDPAHDGKLLMSVLRGGVGEHSSVILDPSWFRPLAAWFAGEAQPAALGDDLLLPYGRRLTVYPDALALVWSTHTEAWLHCDQPYGPARVAVAPRGRMASRSLTVVLPPTARAETAAWLRRADAAHWAESAA